MKKFFPAILYIHLFPVLVFASMSSIPDSYGLHAYDMGTVKSFSPFTAGFSAAYYNPAGLAQNMENNLSLGYLYAKPQLTINNEVAFADPNEVGILGMKFSLRDLTSLGKQVSLGLIIGVDDNFTGLMTINDSVSKSGQFIRYGRGQMLLIPSVGVEIQDWVFVGAGAYISVKADTVLNIGTTLSGTTSDQSLRLKGSTNMSPIVGVLFTPKILSVAAAYRGESDYTVGITTRANATVSGSPLATLPLNLIFLDAYMPHQFDLGVKYPIPDRLSLAAGATYYLWSGLNKRLDEKDTVKGRHGITFNDIVVPRVGIEYVAIPGARKLVVRGGYSYEASPLETTQSDGANILDSPKHVLGLGAGLTFEKLPGLKLPFSIDAAYQAQLLSKRDFTLSFSDGTTQKVDTGGYLNSLDITLTLRF